MTTVDDSAQLASLTLCHYTIGVLSLKRRRWLARAMAPVLVVPVAAVIGCTATAQAPLPDVAVSTPRSIHVEQTITGSVNNPLSGKYFYVDPTTSSVVAAAETQPLSSELLTIAGTPQVRWIGNEVPIDRFAADVNAYVRAAESVNKMPMLALYAIPHRDCGGFSASGFATGDEYRAWVSSLVEGLGTSQVLVVLEPDALTAMDCLPPDLQQERMDLLRAAVDTLTRKANVVLYIDGGHSRWLPAEELARRLIDVGVDRARGFSLNTSNFFTTAEEIAFGERVSALTNGASYVIDTSRNGAGPAPDGPLNWCNPPGRAIGAAPTTNTAGPHADAYLWIKHPGESDGECHRGDPRSGLFFTQYAIDLVRAATP